MPFHRFPLIKGYVFTVVVVIVQKREGFENQLVMEISGVTLQQIPQPETKKPRKPWWLAGLVVGALGHPNMILPRLSASVFIWSKVTVPHLHAKKYGGAAPNKFRN
jgi:hypothetical protein